MHIFNGISVVVRYDSTDLNLFCTSNTDDNSFRCMQGQSGETGEFSGGAVPIYTAKIAGHFCPKQFQPCVQTDKTLYLHEYFPVCLF